MELLPVDSTTLPVTTGKGACERLVNMRREYGWWSPVSHFETLLPLASTNGYDMLYYHPVFTDGGGYIVLDNGSVSYCRIVSGRLVVVAKLCDNKGTRPTVSSVGNILFVSWGNGDTVVERLFLARDNRYEAVDMSRLRPVGVSVSAEYYIHEETNGSGFIHIGDITDNKDGTTTRQISLAEHLGKIHDHGYITGSLYAMVAYRMVDGTLTTGGPAIMMPVEYNDMNLISGGIRRWTDGSSRRFFITMSGAKLTLTLTLPDGAAANPLLRSVAIFTTDAIPIYDGDKLTDDNFNDHSVDGTGSDIFSYAPRTIMLSDVASQTVERPFYLLKEVDISEFSGGKYTFTISREDVKDLIHNELYASGFSTHYTVSSGRYQYNNRLHRYDITTRLHDGSPILCTESTIEVRRVNYHRQNLSGRRLLTVVTLDCDGTTKRVVYDEPAYVYFTNDALAPGNANDRYMLHHNMLSYPDSRAYELSFLLSDGKKARTLARYKLTPCYAHNLSYWCSLTEVLLHHTHVVNLGPGPDYTLSEPLPVKDDLLHEPGKMIVSSSSNPLVYDPRHTYSLGTGTSFVIMKVEAAAGELTQTRYGDYPLLLFTTQGIFAMEQGSDSMLYVRNVKVANDILTGTYDTLSVRGLVFFVTVRGLMALDGRKVLKVSESVDHLLTDDYLQGSRLFYLSAYEEVMLFNPSYRRAYVYAIGSGWTERDFDASPISDSLFVSSRGIFSLDGRESTSPSDMLTPSLLTRPLTLGTDDFKHVDVFAAGISSHPDTRFVITIEGSNDLSVWHPVGSLSSSLRMRHAKASWRYFRIRLSVDPSSTHHIDISSFDIEYYTRFSRHLRSRR